MAFKTEEELQAFADWAKGELQRMAEHAHSSDLFHEEAVGHAVWTLPHQIFIGKVWPKSNRERAFWVISGTELPTDHIDAELAESAREAARHFSMKWQLQSARLGGMDEDRPDVPKDDVDWHRISRTLQAQAEALYGLVEKEEVWRPTQGPLVDPAGENGQPTGSA
jgi:uncharacterized protein YozE (UPF0346 family)